MGHYRCRGSKAGNGHLIDSDLHSLTIAGNTDHDGYQDGLPRANPRLDQSNRKRGLDPTLLKAAC